MQSPESPLKFLNWLKSWAAEGSEGRKGWKGRPNSPCHSLFLICPLIVHKERTVLFQGTVPASSVPLASASDPSSKGPMSTSVDFKVPITHNVLMVGCSCYLTCWHPFFWLWRHVSCSPSKPFCCSTLPYCSLSRSVSPCRHYIMLTFLVW